MFTCKNFPSKINHIPTGGKYAPPPPPPQFFAIIFVIFSRYAP